MSKLQDKNKRIAIFQDTLSQCYGNVNLSEKTAATVNGTRLYVPDKDTSLNFDNLTEKAGQMQISPSRTFEAAKTLHNNYPKSKIAVLNFASATCPGGGVRGGSTAQEESLCRCSTLYPSLSQDFLQETFYHENRMRKDCRHTDECIYSPGVVVFKSDNRFPEMVPEEEWFSVDVISCAAPNLRNNPNNIYNFETGKPLGISNEELYDIHVKRAEYILSVALDNNIDILVLGAFGCGAFENDPYIVAKAYAYALKKYLKYFTIIEFAIYCNRYNMENYDAFVSVFKGEFNAT